MARSCLNWSSDYGPGWSSEYVRRGVRLVAVSPTPLATTDVFREYPGPDARWL
nr:hypothetical protein [Kibdelosporangium sp. MJ126-NF4]